MWVYNLVGGRGVCVEMMQQLKITNSAQRTDKCTNIQTVSIKTYSLIRFSMSEKKN
jgi:hypothetical protein